MLTQAQRRIISLFDGSDELAFIDIVDKTNCNMTFTKERIRELVELGVLVFHENGPDHPTYSVNYNELQKHESEEWLP